MKIIKLDTTKSTNTFLKDLSRTTTVKSGTVVVTKKQSSGRGQMSSKWISEDYKNLTFSILYNFKDLNIKEHRYLNFAISLAVYALLKKLNLPKVSIKWPNDILSVKSKICGILVENTINCEKIESSVIGIGLNVNQKYFPDNIGNVTSIINQLDKESDLEQILHSLLEEIATKIKLVNDKKYDLLEIEYHKALYLKDTPSMFKSDKGLFMGKILGVTTDGKLQMELNDESTEEFGIKEIKFIR